MLRKDISFHPLKSGRDVRNFSNSMLTFQFPSPQVGSGPVMNILYVIEQIMFPSPQVGSGRSDFLLPVAQGNFPSPQVGSGPVARLVLAASATLPFHPLKSGRDRWSVKYLRDASALSIPSSRVGTGSGQCASPSVTWLSIPSSRVGT